MRPCLVSACLIGVRCRYDGTDSFSKELVAALEGRPIVPVCPEQLGGLPTPRSAAEFQGGDGHDVLRGAARVVDREGRDITENFVRGARETLRIALMAGCEEAFLKARSPSCGVGEIYREGQLVPGDGVAAALLEQHGLRVRACS